MVVWEPRNLSRARYLGGPDVASMPDGARPQLVAPLRYNPLLASDPARCVVANGGFQARVRNINVDPVGKSLPPEIAGLHQLGIGYPYLYAATEKSRLTGIPALELLFRTGVLSRDIWFKYRKAANSGISQQSQAQRHRLDQAINTLRRQAPHYSAAHTFSGGQTLFLGAAFLLSLAYYLLFPIGTFAVLFLALALFYFSSVILRGLLLAAFNSKDAAANIEYARSSDDTLPIYSVLVALYHEGGQVKDLTSHLWKLDWPRERLEIKLICEADDDETIAAIRHENLPDCFELVLVPAALPRTKPKALNFALPDCRGEYLVLYDAEDRPSPGQFREAHAKFLASDEHLACLQAPLHIHNAEQCWLTQMFAIEYLTLFNGILPILAKWRVPMPLGGTSNHFNGLR